MAGLNSKNERVINVGLDWTMKQQCDNNGPNFKAHGIWRKC